MITPLTEMLELPNFGHMAKLTLWHYDLNHVIKFCWWRHEKKLWRHNFFFKKLLFFWRPGVDIIKILTTFIKTTLKDSRKVRRIRNYVSKWNLYLYFFIWQNMLISGKKMLISAELKGCVMWFIWFLDLL